MDDAKSSLRGPDESKSSAPLEPRRHALLEVSESIAFYSDPAELFHALAERPPSVVSFDSLWLVLHDTPHNTMQPHILETPVRTGIDVISDSSTPRQPVDIKPSVDGVHTNLLKCARTRNHTEPKQYGWPILSWTACGT